MPVKKKMFAVLAVVLTLAVLGLSVMLLVSSVVKFAAGNRITEDPEAMEKFDCILVLGCQVLEDGTPCDMLRDRLDKAIALYQAGTAPKLLMSGDHGSADYNEVGAMKRYAMEHGVPSDDIFMDHAGFSTYESVYRARDVFQAKRIVIVSQKYHLYRAVYIANQLGLDAYGAAAEERHYSGQIYRDFREVLARCKDAVMSVVKPEPAALGDVISVSGSGDVTND